VDTRRLAPPLTYGGLISKKWLSKRHLLSLNTYFT
jgi:hypothetical protein